MATHIRFQGQYLIFRIPAIWVLTTKLFTCERIFQVWPRFVEGCVDIWESVNKNDSSIPLQNRNLCFRKVTEGGKSPSTVVKLDIKFCHVRVCRKKKISKNVGKKRPLYSIFQGRGGCMWNLRCIFSCATAF